MEIVLATRNKKKVEEIKRIVSGIPVDILTIGDFPGCPEVEEEGNTFEENAVKKALSVAKYTGRPSLADDSGLEVYALNGSPGVMSSRYAGPESDDKKNIEKLLKEMECLDDKKRTARFVCCVALAFPDGDVKKFFGSVEGIVGREPKGNSGFGYDPVFYPEGQSKTFAEMSSDDKDALSHRGRALREFVIFLKDRIFKK